MIDILQDFLRSRRSIRRFLSQPIPPEMVQDLLKTATYAPSAHNLQPWRFVVIENQTTKITLGQALTNQMQRDMQTEGILTKEIKSRVTRSLRRIAEAPLIVLVCRDTQSIRSKTVEEDLMAVQSVAMAGLQLMLAAHAHNLGANWICWPLYAPQATILALKLPETWQPQGLVFIGYPAEQAETKELKEIDENTIFMA
jgi:F420 biosynthesis protein FbiB-like protein